MKEFDIIIKTPPEGDIIVYMLPLYVSINLDSIRVLLDASLRERAIKIITVSNRIELNALLDKTFAQKYVNMSCGFGTKAGGIMSGRLLTQANEDLMTRNGEEIDGVFILDTLPFHEIKTTVPKQISIGVGSANELTASEKKTTSPDASAIGVESGGKDVLTLQTQNGTDILTQSGETVSAIHVIRTLTISEVKTVAPGLHAICIRADDVDTSVVKAITIDAGIPIYADNLPMLYRRSIDLGESAVAFDANAEIILTRYRRLSEADMYTLGELDAMPFESIDYITI